MVDYVLGFQEIDRTHAALVGGKGANLGELSRIEGVRVPAGFCATTDAYRRIMKAAPSLDERLDRLSSLKAGDGDAIRTHSAELRRSIERIAIPDDIASAIARALSRLGERAAVAVRSSATAEDLPTTSFAGQQDTYLNIVGPEEVLRHVSRCWASLFTERAVIYRLRNGLDHRTVSMAVVVQRMVFPHAAGILFTADPISGNRKTSSVEASFGLGEALVSGLVNADAFKVRNGEIIARTVGRKRLAIEASSEGGTQQCAIEPERQEQPVLTDAQVVRLVQLGRRIEAHFGRPQDIEWCLADDDFQIVQSRPITTLFPPPIPETDDQQTHVYVSVGHAQMMTDAIKPLGLSVWQMTPPQPMAEAGGRLFVDVTRGLSSTAGRAGLLELFGKSDPLFADALQSVLDRADIIPPLQDNAPRGAPPVAPAGEMATDPAIVDELITQTQASIAALKREIHGKTGIELLDFIKSDVQELRRILFDARSRNVFMSAMEATWWLNDHLQTWLGEKNAADILTQSVPNNVTSEMGLALLDVADAIRPHPEVVAFLQQVGVDDDDFLNALPALAGGAEARDAIRGWLDEYGMRCVGEIDITRPRWSERPATLVPLILGNVTNFEPGAGEQRFEQGRQQAWRREQELLQRLRELPDGDAKADETKRKIDRVRTFIGYREYPKFAKVCRESVYRQALLEEAERLVQAGVLREKEDIFYLRFDELRDVVRTHTVDEQLLQQRRDDFRYYQTLEPPRVLTSDGERFAGAYHRTGLPAGALVGLAVSTGMAEGRARVVRDIADAAIEPGDILVTAFTDPSWTPLFVAVAALVTEVGGMMTHGAVIAREYGLPAVVGVERATTRIRDGQRIRVHGAEGYVEILS